MNAFTCVDEWLASLFSDNVRLALWAAATGAASMLLYGLCSPQRKLTQLSQDASAARRTLAAYDGDFPGALHLMRRTIGLSLKQVVLAAGPSLLAGVPVLLAWTWLEGRYAHCVGWEPSWAGSWLVVFFAIVAASALSVKFALRLK